MSKYPAAMMALVSLAYRRGEGGERYRVDTWWSCEVRERVCAEFLPSHRHTENGWREEEGGSIHHSLFRCSPTIGRGSAAHCGRCATFCRTKEDEKPPGKRLRGDSKSIPFMCEY